MKEEMGYASGPGAFTIETRKSVVGGKFAVAPAAVTDSIVGSIILPAAFCTFAKGSLFWRA